MGDMVVDQVKKAEILYEFGSIQKFLKNFFSGTSVDFAYLQIIYSATKKEYESHEVETNWETREGEFLSEGYSRDDIRYYDDDEALAAIRDEAIESMACDLTRDYFSNNQEMIPYLVKYIESEIL